MNLSKSKKNKIKCDICKTENTINTNYCIKCGNNLSDKIELTDILFFITRLVNVIAIFFFILMMFGLFSLNIFISMFGARNSLNTYVNVLLPFLFVFGINYIIRRYTIGRCKKNLDQNKEVSDGKN